MDYMYAKLKAKQKLFLAFYSPVKGVRKGVASFFYFLFLVVLHIVHNSIMPRLVI